MLGDVGQTGMPLCKCQWDKRSPNVDNQNRIVVCERRVIWMIDLISMKISDLPVCDRSQRLLIWL